MPDAVKGVLMQGATIPLVTVAVQIVVVVELNESVRVTVPPIGTEAPGNFGVSVVANVTAWLTMEGLGVDDAIVMVVGDGVTAGLVAAAFEVPKFASPE